MVVIVGTKAKIMGCDIHAHIEVKIRGRWEHYSCPPFIRNYQIFERICGVRGDEKEAIAPPRGLPHDMSAVTRACYEHEHRDAHSMTWLTREEFCSLIDWVEKEVPGGNIFQHHHIGYLTGNGFNLHPGSNPKEITDVRFICWFDN